MNNDWYPEFIQIKRDDLCPLTVDKVKSDTMYSRDMFVMVNFFNRDEISNLEYVRADKYYAALDILGKLITNKDRLKELEEMACKILLES